jgi:hypothetical protein
MAARSEDDMGAGRWARVLLLSESKAELGDEQRMGEREEGWRSVRRRQLLGGRARLGSADAQSVGNLRRRLDLDLEGQCSARRPGLGQSSKVG